MMRVLALIIGVGLCVGVAYGVYNALDGAFLKGRPNLDVVDRPVSNDVSIVIFQVRPGQSAQSIGEELQNRSLIRSSLTFRLAVETRGAENRLAAGDYELSPSFTTAEIVNRLTRGDTRRGTMIAIPEGWRLREVAQKLETSQLMNAQDFIGATSLAPPGLSQAPPNADLEGYLFPDSYEVGLKTTPQELVNSMVQEFERNFNTRLREEAGQRGLTVHQAVTLASIIEREAAVASERPLISAVYHNRLKIGMRLQADPTVQYAVANANASTPLDALWKRDLSNADLQLVSPYNTYVSVGLPPGPICNPGLDSLRAAVEPASVDYLYFVAKGDGSHAFARTEPEHRANVQTYR
jgi:UPF0755 protein